MRREVGLWTAERGGRSGGQLYFCCATYQAEPSYDLASPCMPIFTAFKQVVTHTMYTDSIFLTALPDLPLAQTPTDNPTQSQIRNPKDSREKKRLQQQWGRSGYIIQPTKCTCIWHFQVSRFLARPACQGTTQGMD